jgi:predicted amidophosphoribosyltransferase
MQGIDRTGERPRGVIAAALGRAVRSLADIVVPPVCLACRTPLVRHHEVCGACWRDIRFIRPPLCDRLGLPMPFGAGEGVGEAMISAAAVANPPAYGRARAVAAYDGVMRDLIHAFKYADRHDACRLFGTWLVSAGAPLIPGITTIVPVPLAWTRLLRRQFNQAAILAQETSRLTGLPYAPQVLRRTRSTRSQVGLSRLERGAISAARLLSRRDIGTGSKAPACFSSTMSSPPARRWTRAPACCWRRERSALTYWHLPSWSSPVPSPCSRNPWALRRTE